MKIYISGPITGVDNYSDNFNCVEDKLKAAGFAVINPAKLNECMDPIDTPWRQYVDVGLVMLNCCDAVYMLDGWESSAGALIEKKAAEKANKIIIY